MDLSQLLYFDEPTDLLAHDGIIYVSLADAAKMRGVSIPAMRKMFAKKTIKHKGCCYIELDLFKTYIAMLEKVSREVTNDH